MEPHVRDAILAAVCGAFLLAILAVQNALNLLLQPRAAALGVAVGLLVEAAFVADTPAGRLWERRSVQVASVAALVIGGIAVAWTGSFWLVAAACWGLATYFGALALVVTGIWNAGE